jgi:hypothetical protein
MLKSRIENRLCQKHNRPNTIMLSDWSYWSYVNEEIAVSRSMVQKISSRPGVQE